MTLLSKLSKAHRSRSSSPALRPVADQEHANFSKSPYSLSIAIESPPVVLYGPPNESTGYLLSGLLYLDIPFPTNGHLDLHPTLSANSAMAVPARHASSTTLLTRSPAITPVASNLSLNHSQSSSPSLSPSDPKQLLKSVSLSLNQIITYGKPFLPPSNTLANCSECKTKVTTLKRWDVLTQPALFPPGKQAFPFSHILPGNLPPTCAVGSSGAFTIRYELVAQSHGIYESSKSKKQKSCEIKVKMPIRVSRSIIKGLEKNSLRIFPPSNVTVAASIPNVVHPKSDFVVELKFEGLVDGNKRWRLRRLQWRIEETAQIKANSCDLSYHKTKLKVIESNIRLNEEHKIPGSTYSLGSTVRRRHDLATPADIPSADQEEEGQEIAATERNQDSFLHPSDHEANNIVSSETSAPASGLNPVSSIPLYQTSFVPPEDEHELFLEEVRTIEKGALREGWKSDYSNNGTIEVAVDVSCRRLSSGLVNHIKAADSRTSPSHIDRGLDIGSDANCACEVYDPINGVYVTHTLIMEANLAEELTQPINGGSASFREARNLKSSPKSLPQSTSPSSEHTPTSTNSGPATDRLGPNSSSSNPKGTNHGTTTIPSGLTRLFRMKFKLLVTERSGFGISWDEEVPPQYNQVSSFSPPTYGEALAFDDTELSELRI
ncbi:Ldb19 protein [Saccharomycopsis crataegensis]|uniref:Ldb19 protein n=1 Tax=Saccharomycopsis crataegensis TaxID=43959 RepID=A0AAV5QDA9_9ASCO|nr:Ldb19 protein [Saccharomycopsis crataegensis]